MGKQDERTDERTNERTNERTDSLLELAGFYLAAKNFYQQNPPGTLKVVWILLNPIKFAKKIDLLIKVPDVEPYTVEKMRSPKICRINKITVPCEQIF